MAQIRHIRTYVAPSVAGMDLSALNTADRDEPLTAVLTSGDEHFEDSDGNRYPIIGTTLAFNASFGPKADTTLMLESMARAGLTCIRLMHFDNVPSVSVPYSTATSRRNWWTTLGVWPTSDPESAIDPTAKDRFLWMVAECYRLGLRIFVSFDHLIDTVARGRGRTTGCYGSTSSYEWSGQWWQATLMQDVKDYITWFFGITNNYRNNISFGNDPTFVGIFAQNENSLIRSYFVSNVGGTLGVDRLFQDATARAAWAAEWDSDWAAYWAGLPALSGTTIPWGAVPGDAFVGFPHALYPSSATRMVFGSLDPLVKARVIEWILAKSRYIHSQLTTHLASVAPNVVYSGSTLPSGGAFSNFTTEYDTPLGGIHWYMNRTTASQQHQSPTTPAITAAVWLAGTLTVTIATTTTSNKPVTNKPCQLSGITFTLANPNGIYTNMTRISDTQFTVPTADPGVMGVGAATCDLAGRIALPSYPVVGGGTPIRGDSWLSNNNLSTPGAYGVLHIDQQIQIIDELGHNGMGCNDFLHMLIATVLCLKHGKAGFMEFDWRDTAAIDPQTMFLGDLSTCNHPGRALAFSLMSYMLRHRVLDLLPNLIYRALTDTSVTSKIVGGGIYATSWYETVANNGMNTADWRAICNNISSRVRISKNPGADSVANVGTTSGTRFDFGLGGAADVIWDKGVAGTPTNRLEFPLSTKISGVAGSLPSGTNTFGRVTYAGMPADSAGGIILVTADGSNLAASGGDAVLFNMGMTQNEGFVFNDTDETYYISYLSTPASITSHDVTITLAGMAGWKPYWQTDDNGKRMRHPCITSGSDLIIRGGLRPVIYLEAP